MLRQSLKLKGYSDYLNNGKQLMTPILVSSLILFDRFSSNFKKEKYIQDNLHLNNYANRKKRIKKEVKKTQKNNKLTQNSKRLKNSSKKMREKDNSNG